MLGQTDIYFHMAVILHVEYININKTSIRTQEHGLHHVANNTDGLLLLYMPQIWNVTVCCH